MPLNVNIHTVFHTNTKVFNYEELPQISWGLLNIKHVQPSYLSKFSKSQTSDTSVPKGIRYCEPLI